MADNAKKLLMKISKDIDLTKQSTSRIKYVNKTSNKIHENDKTGKNRIQILEQSLRVEEPQLIEYRKIISDFRKNVP